MTIATSLTISVYPDPDYHFEISAADDEINLRYFEGKPRVVERELAFASLEEMEAVAHAMLDVVAARK